GYEALLRWQRSDGQILAPGAFTAALEDPRLSARIGREVIRMALDQAREWKLQGFEFGSIAINVGASQFRDGDLADHLFSELTARDLSPTDIEIEVTEGVFLSNAADDVLETCRRLQAHGIRIAFDDFGTGFASLTHLQRF